MNAELQSLKILLWVTLYLGVVVFFFKAPGPRVRGLYENLTLLFKFLAFMFAEKNLKARTITGQKLEGEILNNSIHIYF